MKKMLAVVLAMIQLAALFGYAQAEDDVIELRFSWWGDTARHEVYNNICDAFEAENPDIRIIRESSTYSDYWNKLATQVAGGNAPDVFGIHPHYVSDYAARDTMADLEPYIESGIIETENIPDNVLESGRINGKIRMISQGPSGSSIFANKTLLDTVGIEIPTMTEDWTWNEFAEKAVDFRQKALEQGIDAYFCDDFTINYSAFRFFVRGKGSELYTEDGQLGFTAEDLNEWFTFWKTLRDADAIPDAATTTEDSAGTMEQKNFTRGNTALTNVAVNQFYQYSQQMPEAELVTVRIPTGEDGGRGEYVEGAYNAIYEGIDEEHKEAAARFLNFFVNSESSLQYLKMEQGAPTNTLMAEFIKPLLEKEQVVSLEYINMLGELQDHPVIYAPKGATAIENAYKTAMESVAYGVEEPAAAAEAFVSEAQKIIEENQ